MVDFRKLLAREPRPSHGGDGKDTELDSGAPRGARLEAEYEALIASQCLRWGISDSSFTVEVRQLGRASNGLEIYVGMLRLARWERDSAVRLLLGLPLLETKIRRTVRGLWLCEVSHFGGLWLHASEQLQATDAMVELRQLVLQLTPAAASPGGDHHEEAYPSVMGSIPPGNSTATSHVPLVVPGESQADKPDSD